MPCVLLETKGREEASLFVDMGMRMGCSHPLVNMNVVNKSHSNLPDRD